MSYSTTMPTLEPTTYHLPPPLPPVLYLPSLCLELACNSNHQFIFPLFLDFASPKSQRKIPPPNRLCFSGQCSAVRLCFSDYSTGGASTLLLQ
ncbi:hypothetical protein L1887_22491 [Cichorium endivia]|nr:hypothetical protein L1887_22491 [Cichorium endivia]